MRYIVAIAGLLLLAACNNNDHSAPSGPVIDSLSGNTTAQPGIVPRSITAGELPATLHYRGQLHEAFTWTDRLGENILITSTVPVYRDTAKTDDFGEDARSAELYAFHFVKKDTAWHLLWQLGDAEKECPFDVTCAFLDHSVTVTDLDHNGIAETKVQYKLACRSDVSPAYMKLIMHEDSTKYSLRGMMWVKTGDDDQFTVTPANADLEKLPKKKDEYEQLLQTFGRYETEREFAMAPPAFLEYAREQWMQFVVEIIN